MLDRKFVDQNGYCALHQEVNDANFVYYGKTRIPNSSVTILSKHVIQRILVQ